MDGQGNEGSALFHNGFRRGLLTMPRGTHFRGVTEIRESQQENSDGVLHLPWSGLVNFQPEDD